MFPLRDYILEVKAFLPDEYDTNPPYGELFRTDKPTSMMITLHAGGWKKKVGRLVWNTIKYDRGFDIAIEECDANYKAYRSFPAGGKKEQIWAWNFFEDYLELTCDGELQYEQNFDEGDVNARKPGLPKSCRALGDADVDRITVKHMAGRYIRGRPKTVKETTLPQIETTAPPTTEPNTVSVDPGVDDIIQTEEPATEEPEDIEEPEVYPTCDCWTPECGYCSDPECTVKHDLINSKLGITVHSHINRKDLNSIMLLDEEGNAIGTFQWNRKSIHLTGCVSCQTPPAVRKFDPKEMSDWSFSFHGGVVTLTVGGEVLYENKLRGKCVEKYSQATRFAFYGMACENSFDLLAGMEAGERVTADCAGACPQE